MIIPFFNPGRPTAAFPLLLLAAYLLLVFTGLGVFRLYFDFEWNGSDAAGSGELFNLKIRGGNSFNLFESRPLGSIFWTTQFVTLCLAVLLPFLRVVAGSLIALIAAIGIYILNYLYSPSVPGIPLEFQLLMVFILYCLYLLLSYFSEVRERKKFATLLSQYVPPELATEYSRNPGNMGLDGDAREVTVLFCDVIGFSRVSERMEPPEVAQWLNAFFSRVSKVVVRHSGTIDKYVGDSVMAFWGAPAPSLTHAFDAVTAARDIHLEVLALSDEMEARGLPGIKVGVGISTGTVNVGNLGSEYRSSYTVVGDTVNVAQRLEKQTRRYHVPTVVSLSTAESVDQMLFREVDTIPVEGRSGLVKMYEPLILRSDADDEFKGNLARHRKAMLASKSGDWEEATRGFKQLREDWGPVEMYDLYLRGIEASAGSDSGSGSV